MVALCAVVLVWYVVKTKTAPSTSCEPNPVIAYDMTTVVSRSFASLCEVPPGWAIEVAASKDTQYSVNGDTMQRFRDERVGITTAYRESPEGYVLLSLPPQVRDSNALTAAYSFIQQRDMVALAESRGPREGPQAITLHVYENPRALSLEAWIAEFAGTINYRSELGEARATRVAEQDARMFRGDGLYPSQTVVFMHRSFVIVVTGTFNSPEDRIYKDFLDIVGSIALL
jgi:hypothetical protein